MIVDHTLFGELHSRYNSENDNVEVTHISEMGCMFTSILTKEQLNAHIRTLRRLSEAFDEGRHERDVQRWIDWAEENRGSPKLKEYLKGKVDEQIEKLSAQGSPWILPRTWKEVLKEHIDKGVVSTAGERLDAPTPEQWAKLGVPSMDEMKRLAGELEAITTPVNDKQAFLDMGLAAITRAPVNSGACDDPEFVFGDEDPVTDPTWIAHRKAMAEFNAKEQDWEAVNKRRAEMGLTKVYPYPPAHCPSDHYNDGTDICADCGTDLNPVVTAIGPDGQGVTITEVGEIVSTRDTTLYEVMQLPESDRRRVADALVRGLIVFTDY